MKVPQLSPWVGEEEYKAIKDCFDNNWITEGPKAKEFTEKLLKLMGVKYGVFAPNGTLALYLGLRALGVGPGDEVIVPDFTFLASATSVEMTGATPVFVDVNRKNFQIDLSNADKLISKKTKAIMPVHIFGTVADMEDVIKFAKKHKLKIIEDACEAIGVHREGRHAGTFGEVGCFSFFADKTITTGEGGFVVTDDKDLYEQLVYFRQQGRLDRGTWVHPKIGYNFRMTDLQIAVGLVQLGKLQEIKRRKLKLLALYKKLLAGVSGVTFFEPDKEAEILPFRVCILVDRAHELMAYMRQKDIEPRSFFYPLHKQPGFSYLKFKGKSYQDSDFPNAIYGYDHGICLPVFPTLTEEQVTYICEVIKDFQMPSNLYQKYYDFIYQNKDYKKETNLIFDLSKKFGIKSPQKILEIGCGTGNHTIELAKTVKQVLAVDIDSQMVGLAKDKIEQHKIKNVTFFEGEVEKLNSGSFDLAVAMFNVVTYIYGMKQLVTFMKGVSSHLKPGGILIFDVWNGVAAIKDPPRTKKTAIRQNGILVESELTSQTDFFNQKTTLNYDIKVTNGKLIEQGSFSFDQTLWTPMQINQALSEAGLGMMLCSPLMKPNEKATEKDWKIMFVAKKYLMKLKNI